MNKVFNSRYISQETEVFLLLLLPNNHIVSSGKVSKRKTKTKMKEKTDGNFIHARKYNKVFHCFSLWNNNKIIFNII